MTTTKPVDSAVMSGEDPKAETVSYSIPPDNISDTLRFADDAFWLVLPNGKWGRLSRLIAMRRLVRSGMDEKQANAALDYAQAASGDIEDPDWDEAVAFARLLGDSIAQYVHFDEVLFINYDNTVRSMDVEEVNAYLKTHCPSIAPIDEMKESRFMWPASSK